MAKVAGVWMPGWFVRPSSISGWTGGGTLIRVPIDLAVILRLCEMFTAEGRAWKYARGGILNKHGDFWIGDVPKAKRARCGAKTRKGTPCQARCMGAARQGRKQPREGPGSPNQTAGGRQRHESRRAGLPRYAIQAVE
jgi:hypothetical protein